MEPQDCFSISVVIMVDLDIIILLLVIICVIIPSFVAYVLSQGSVSVRLTFVYPCFGI